MTTLEEVRKSLIKDQESFEEKDLISLGQKISAICSLDKNGEAHFHRQLKDMEKIKFALAARFIARKIEDFFADKSENERISASVRNEELEKMLKISKPQVRARLSDLRKESLIEDLDRDSHQIKSLALHKILENAEDK